MLLGKLLPPQWIYAYRVFRRREPQPHRSRFLRDLLGWTVPVAVQSLVLSALSRSRGLDVSSNGIFRNRHPGRRCFVIGNGPSLARMDLRPLANEITIGANSFYKHPHAAEVGLKYLCVGDASFMTDEPKSVEWHRVIDATMPGTTLILHPEARRIIGRHGLYPGRNVHYFRSGLATNVPESLELDFTRPINVGLNTGTRLCIPLALHMGCNDVILLGFDANWLDDIHGSYHFYRSHEQFPQFDSVMADARVVSYECELLGGLRDFEAHRVLQEHAKRLGATIRNATLGGRLDMHPRVSYEDLFPA